jgi:GT2 family glycosyltransferase
MSAQASAKHTIIRAFMLHNGYLFLQLLRREPRAGAPGLERRGRNGFSGGNGSAHHERAVAERSATTRPAVDVVVPFRGSRSELERLQERLGCLTLRPGDSVLIVDNTPHRSPALGDTDEPIPVLRAAERRTPGFARNRGAALGSAEWIVFLDADTEPGHELLDRYFATEPDPVTALIGGGIRDEPVASSRRLAARYQYMWAGMSQDNTFRLGSWGFPVTANVAVRRAAFEQIGGFREDIRAAEDADLTYRLRAAGWVVERREDATVTHRCRPTMGSFLRQQILHAAGAAWLERHYPGSSPSQARLGFRPGAVRVAAGRLVAAVGSGDRDRIVWALCEPAQRLAWKYGRSLPNSRPLKFGMVLRALRRAR